jgi:molybdopterin molybdotransferase
LRRLAGETAGRRETRTATAAVGWKAPPGKRQFVRARFEDSETGELRVRPVGGQGSHLVADLAEATCLAVVDEDVTEVAAGDEVPCLVLDAGGAW